MKTTVYNTVEFFEETDAVELLPNLYDNLKISMLIHMYVLM